MRNRSPGFQLKKNVSFKEQDEPFQNEESSPLLRPRQVSILKNKKTMSQDSKNSTEQDKLFGQSEILEQLIDKKLSEEEKINPFQKVPTIFSKKFKKFGKSTKEFSVQASQVNTQPTFQSSLFNSSKLDQVERQPSLYADSKIKGSNTSKIQQLELEIQEMESTYFQLKQEKQLDKASLYPNKVGKKLIQQK